MYAFFETSIKFLKVNDAGNQVLSKGVLLIQRNPGVTNPYSAAEEKARGWSLANGLFVNGIIINSIKESNICQVFAGQDGQYYYKCKIVLIIVDEESGKEKKKAEYFIQQADSVEQAINRFKDNMSYLVVPFEEISVSNTNIIDVIEHITPEGA